MEFKIKEKIEKGYSLDLGKLIEDCFEIYKKTFLIAGLGYILMGIVIAILYFSIFMIFMGASDITEWAVKIENMQFQSNYLIGSVILTVVFTALIAPLNAGFLKLCLLAKKNQELNLGVIFEYYNSKYVKDIIIGSVIISFITVTLSTLFQRFEIPALGFVIQVIVPFFTVLFIPLVIFANQNYGEALQNSVKLVVKKPFHIALALIIALIGMFLGLIALCIGMFFTIPIYTAMIFSIYDNVVGFEENSVIDEIGQIEE